MYHWHFLVIWECTNHEVAILNLTHKSEFLLESSKHESNPNVKCHLQFASNKIWYLAENCQRYCHFWDNKGISFPPLHLYRNHTSQPHLEMHRNGSIGLITNPLLLYKATTVFTIHLIFISNPGTFFMLASPYCCCTTKLDCFRITNVPDKTLSWTCRFGMAYSFHS